MQLALAYAHTFLLIDAHTDKLLDHDSFEPCKNCSIPHCEELLVNSKHVIPLMKQRELSILATRSGKKRETEKKKEEEGEKEKIKEAWMETGEGRSERKV